MVSEASRQDRVELPVSVVIPVYNRAHLLGRALASVSAQRSYRAAEVVVVDDGSTDGSGDLAKQLGARVVRMDANRGQAAARNAGVEAAAQPWIAFLDSDDEWLPHHLASVWRLVNGHVLLGTSALNCRTDASRDRVVGPLTDRPALLTSPTQLLHPHNFLTTSTTVAQRGAMLAVGGFRAHGGVVEDLDMWVRLLEHGTGLVSPEVTVTYHVHEIRLSDDVPRTRAGHRSVALAYAHRPWWTSSLLLRWEGAAGWDDLRDALDLGRRGEAVRHAIGLLRRPVRLRGTLELLRWRFRARRTSARVNRDGAASIASWLLSRENRQPPEGLDLRVDAAGDVRCLAGAALQLARRPTGIVLIDSWAGHLLARGLRIRPIDVRRNGWEAALLPGSFLDPSG